MTAETTTQTLEQPVDTTQSPRYAGFMVRMYANVIDMLALLLILLLLFPGSMGATHLTPEIAEKAQQLQQHVETGVISSTEYMQQMRDVMVEARGGEAVVRRDFILQTSLLVLYFAIAWKYCRPTPGKRLFRLGIVDSTTFAEASLKQVIVRFIGYIISSIPLGLGFIWVLFSKRKQGWHDIMAHTVVIYTKELPADWQKKRFKYQSIVAILLILGFLIYNRITHQ